MPKHDYVLRPPDNDVKDIERTIFPTIQPSCRLSRTV